METLCVQKTTQHAEVKRGKTYDQKHQTRTPRHSRQARGRPLLRQEQHRLRSLRSTTVCFMQLLRKFRPRLYQCSFAASLTWRLVFGSHACILRPPAEVASTSATPATSVNCMAFLNLREQSSAHLPSRASPTAGTVLFPSLHHVLTDTSYSSSQSLAAQTPGVTVEIPVDIDQLRGLPR